jgi:hypothetical protein
VQADAEGEGEEEAQHVQRTQLTLANAVNMISSLLQEKVGVFLPRCTESIHAPAHEGNCLIPLAYFE